MYKELKVKMQVLMSYYIVYGDEVTLTNYQSLSYRRGGEHK